MNHYHHILPFLHWILIGLRTSRIYLRADSRFVPIQWETSLQNNTISHWLGANLESALYLPPHGGWCGTRSAGPIPLQFPCRINIQCLHSKCNYSELPNTSGGTNPRVAIWYKTKFGSQNFGYQIRCLFCNACNVFKNMFNISLIIMW